VVSLALTLEPLFGSLLGWALGVAGAPGWRTFVGGAALVAAVGFVVVASSRRAEKGV
jgi:hypothetical protein